MVRFVALIPFIAVLACTTALHCWTGTSQAKYYKEDCETIPQDKGSTFCGTLVMTVGNVTSKSCGGTLAKQGAKCEKVGTLNVTNLGTATCCSGDYCNGDGVGGDIEALQQEIERLKRDLAEAEEARKKEEEARALAEADKETAQSATQAAEKGKADAEKAREQAEADKTKAQKEKAESEKARDTAEADKKEAEKRRKNAEAEKKSVKASSQSGPANEAGTYRITSSIMVGFSK